MPFTLAYRYCFPSPIGIPKAANLPTGSIEKQMPTKMMPTAISSVIQKLGERKPQVEFDCCCFMTQSYDTPHACSFTWVNKPASYPAKALRPNADIGSDIELRDAL